MLSYNGSRLSNICGAKVVFFLYIYKIIVIFFLHKRISAGYLFNILRIAVVVMVIETPLMGVWIETEMIVIITCLAKNIVRTSADITINHRFSY